MRREHPLDGFHRLRSDRYRIVFHYATEGKANVIKVDYINRRELVYEIFSDMVEQSMQTVSATD
jgi:mRNA-degrading endonuclease RelE of RelBE toxin-antitoxin system